MDDPKILEMDVIGYLGEEPGLGAEWWTEEDWQRHREYVERLKKEGNYLKPVKYHFSMVHMPLFDAPELFPNKEPYGNFAMLIPDGVTLKNESDDKTSDAVH